jgi:hypothetical protein
MRIMSFHQSPSALTSRQAAIENLPADAGQQRKLFDDLFAARDRQREEVRKIRDAQKVRERESAMTENLGIDPMAIKSMKMWREAFMRNDYRASVAFTQFMIFANAQGWPEEREAPEDETPVMDRTRTAKRMSHFNPARGGSRATYGLTLQNAYQLEVTATAERLYQKLVDGVPVNRLREGEGAGRPSKAWQEAYYLAYQRFENENDPSLQDEVPSSDEQAA